MNRTRWAATIGTTVLLLATLGTGLSLAAYHLVKGQTANEPGKPMRGYYWKLSGDGEATVQGKSTPRSPTGSQLPEDGKKMNVSGQILDADGKPLTGAEVAILGVPQGIVAGAILSSRQSVALRSGKTDSEGRFRLDLERHLFGFSTSIGVAVVSRGVAVTRSSWQALDP